jgi:hypothetical protein
MNPVPPGMGLCFFCVEMAHLFEEEACELMLLWAEFELNEQHAHGRFRR